MGRHLFECLDSSCCIAREAYLVFNKIKIKENEMKRKPSIEMVFLRCSQRMIMAIIVGALLSIIIVWPFFFLSKNRLNPEREREKNPLNGIASGWNDEHFIQINIKCSARAPNKIKFTPMKKKKREEYQCQFHISRASHWFFISLFCTKFGLGFHFSVNIIERIVYLNRKNKIKLHITCSRCFKYLEIPPKKRECTWKRLNMDMLS